MDRSVREKKGEGAALAVEPNLEGSIWRRSGGLASLFKFSPQRLAWDRSARRGSLAGWVWGAGKRDEREGFEI
jgi:hypothetical protein